MTGSQLLLSVIIAVVWNTNEKESGTKSRASTQIQTAQCEMVGGVAGGGVVEEAGGGESGKHLNRVSNACPRSIIAIRAPYDACVCCNEEVLF